jgi:hypothetical protein
MRERPEGGELLQIAASTLREQLLPTLSEEQKYPLLMALNAIQIAQRHLELDQQPLRNERELLESLLKRRSSEGDLRAQVAELEREFARRVRAGGYDQDGLGQRVLWQITIQRVRESAPRHLESEGIE